MPLMRRIKSSAARGAICKDFILRIKGIRHGVARLRHIRGARFTQWGEVEVQIRYARRRGDRLQQAAGLGQPFPANIDFAGRQFFQGSSTVYRRSTRCVSPPSTPLFVCSATISG
jgi:hypothetical protein